MTLLYRRVGLASASTCFLALALTLSVQLQLGRAQAAADTDPEPPTDTKAETASPAVDLTDPKLARQAALHRTRSQNNLKQIGIAVHSYHDAYNRLPADIMDAAGKKALLSWRVQLLPYMEQGALYKEFKLDEPWDSKHNLKLLEKMPDVYRSPRVKLKNKGSTVYQAFTGPDAVFGRAAPLRLVNIPDGTSNTIMAVETSTAVPWTRPQDIPFDRKKAVPDFGKAYGKRPLAVMFDGSTRLLNLDKIKAETLKNAIDPADGLPLGADWD